MPENVYAEEGLGLTDGDEVDHLDDLLRADGQWLYYGVEAERFLPHPVVPGRSICKAKLAQLTEELGRRQAVSVVDLDHKRTRTPPEAEQSRQFQLAGCSCGLELVQLSVIWLRNATPIEGRLWLSA